MNRNSLLSPDLAWWKGLTSFLNHNVVQNGSPHTARSHFQWLLRAYGQSANTIQNLALTPLGSASCKERGGGCGRMKSDVVQQQLMPEATQSITLQLRSKPSSQPVHSHWVSKGSGATEPDVSPRKKYCCVKLGLWMVHLSNLSSIWS